MADQPSEARRSGRAYIADEQCVAGEDGVGIGDAAIEIVDKNRNRFGRVARRFERFQAEASKFDYGAVCERGETVFGLCLGAKINRGASAVSQFQVACDEIRVQMSEDHVLDFEFVLGGEFQIARDVALRIDDGGCARLLVTNQVGRVREAV